MTNKSFRVSIGTTTTTYRNAGAAHDAIRDARQAERGLRRRGATVPRIRVAYAGRKMTIAALERLAWSTVLCGGRWYRANLARELAR